MKKLFISLLAVTMLAAAVCGCAGTKNIKLDVFATGSRLREGCNFEFPIEQIESAHGMELLAIDESLVAKDDSGSKLYLALNAESPEHILVIEAVDEAAAKTLNDGPVKGLIDTCTENYSRYSTEQLPKVTSCINKVAGRYVFLIISNDNAAAGKLLDSIIDEAPEA